MALIIAAGASALTASPAAALNATDPALNRGVAELNITKAICGAAGVLTKAAGLACGALTNGGELLRAGKQLVNGKVGGVVSTLTGGGAGAVASTASTALGLVAIGAWLVGGADAVLHGAEAALSATTTPQLHTTWFSAAYWRMAAIAALLTLPFLFATTVQALLRSDAMLLARAAFGYLPLAMLAIAIAAPLTTLLLAASDELCTLISSAAADEGPHFIAAIILAVGGLTGLAKAPFLVFLVALFTIGAAFALWIELLLREAAVYVVVLMLPLAFAALAWPARRVWAIRAVELLVALILSKFAIVAVLSLGGAAIDHGAGHLGVTSVMAGAVLIMLATLSPWALLRLIPLAEIAAGAAAPLRREIRAGGLSMENGVALARSGDEWATAAMSDMRRDAELADTGASPRTPPPPPSSPPPRGADDDNSPPPRSADDDNSPPPRSADDDNSPPPRSADDDPGPPRGPDDAPPPPGPPPTPPAEEASTPSSTVEHWASQPALELGKNFGDTPVYPHPDAQ